MLAIHSGVSMGVLSFNSDRHEYAVDGAPKPSVTGIMRACGLTSSFEFRDKIHAFRGSIVHAGSAIIIAGGSPQLAPLRPPHNGYEDYVRVHSEIPGYWDAMNAAKRSIGFTGAIYECALIDERRCYGGTFDFCAYTDRGQLWDIKSGVYPPLTVIQVCGYEDLILRGKPINQNHPGLAWLQNFIRSGEVFQRCGLRLEKTGKFTAYYETTKGEPYSSPKWMAAWRSALCLYTTVPDHEFVYQDMNGKPHKGSRLSDLRWVAEIIRERLKGVQYELAMRAGENLWHVRSQYGLI